MTGTRPALVLTRQDRSDDALARAAEAAGAEVIRLALFETRPGSQVDAFVAWLGAAGSGAALAWTSRRAALVLASTALPEHRGALARLPLFAVGPESAGPLSSEGLPVRTPLSGLGASHLAAHLLEEAPALGIRRVAFLHGDRALPDLPESLAREGLPVDRFELYRTMYLQADPTPLLRALDARRPCIVAFFSPSGIAGLERLLDPENADALHADASCLARGETTYQALLRWGYQRASRPTGAASASFDAFVLDALHSGARNPS